MSDLHDISHRSDLAPGDVESSVTIRVLGYLTGLGLAILLTATSFFVAGTDLVWLPSIPVAIIGMIMVPVALSLRSIDLKAPARGH